MTLKLERLLLLDTNVDKVKKKQVLNGGVAELAAFGNHWVVLKILVDIGKIITMKLNELKQLIREEILKLQLEEKAKRDRCLRIADRKFDKPSAYKSGAVVRCRKGDIWKNLK